MGRLDPRSTRKSMRIRALILIVVTVGWVLPTGALACPSDTPKADAHSQVAHHDGHEHTHAASHHGRGDHDHAAGPESRRGEPGAPLDAPSCCSDDPRAPALLAAVLDAKPRPKSIPLALPNPLLDVPQPVVLPSGARLRLRQPAPLPYARTRRPLLI